MGKQLKKFTFDNGTVVEEKVCEDYICRFCDANANACNYVGGMCLQVFPRHKQLCGSFVDNETYSGFISDCSTCKYKSATGDCLHE
jgi:hypothetical protein